MTRTALTLLVAGSASAQPDMLICVEDLDGNGLWSITAEYLSNPPSAIEQVWADTSFELTGDGSDIRIVDFNPSYSVGIAPFILDGEIFRFEGNSNVFFGIPDPSNPLWVLDVQYFGDPSALGMTLLGQNSAIFQNQPFGDVRLYQDAMGNPGELTYDIKIIPAPATLALAPIALVAARRRRKSEQP